MIDGSAGGHFFKSGRCDCGIALVDIQWITEEDAGKEHIAHAGKVTLHEISQIQNLAAAMRLRVNTAFGWR